MTPTEAKAALALCPPEDDTNPSVPGLAGALELVAASPELSAWWEQEKIFDQLFARKLSSLTPPAELSPTIMRGGATIFFASRLIAESTDDEAEDLPPPSESPVLPRSVPVAEIAGESETLAKPTASAMPKYFWRTGLVLVGVLGLLLLAGLFWFEYGLASKTAAATPSKSFLLIEPLVMEAIHVPAAPAPVGSSLSEIKKYLQDNRAPNPPTLPALVSQPVANAAITVSVENWSTHTVTHFTVQSGQNSSHLFILNTGEFSLNDRQIADFSREKDAFDEHIWNADGFFYIEMTPLAPKP